MVEKEQEEDFSEAEEKIKNIKEIEQEESDLEEAEDIPLQDSDDEEIQDEKFVEFMNPANTKTSPALGQVAEAPELKATDLEQDLPNQGIGKSTKKEEEDPFKYKIGENSEEEPKYVVSENDIEKTTMPSKVDMMSLGKEPNPLPNPVGFSQSPTAKIGDSSDIEKYVSPDKMDIDKAGKQDLFEKKEVKYKPSANH